MRLVFLGTPAFAVPTLEALIAAGHDVICVVTQPDRPSGRGRQLAFSPVKEAALRHALPLYQPERVRRPESVQHLAALGHRDIAFVSGPMRLHSAQSRLAAFHKSIQECGISPDPSRIIEGDHTLEGGVAAAEKLLALPNLPTGVLCSNDMTAIGVLHKLYRTGLRVPDDISLIGFDDIHIAEVMMPPLTTIQMSCVEIAKTAFAALRQQAESPDALPGKREFPIHTNLIVRESTSFPRGAMTHLRKKE